MTDMSFTRVKIPGFTRPFSVAQYIQHEHRTGLKHYYKNGIIHLMAGGTPPHARIGGNVFAQLTFQVEDYPEFEVFNSDQKVFVPLDKTYNYPDCCAVCGKATFTKDAAQAMKNPILIVEVLSKNTRDYDKKKKFAEYKTIPSFREYVLIHQDQALVLSFFKNENGDWIEREPVSGLENSFKFKSVPAEIPLQKIYRNVDFSEVF